jgi:hypothetical protein
MWRVLRAIRDSKFKVRVARQNGKQLEGWSIGRNEAQADMDEGGEGGDCNEMEKVVGSNSDSSSEDEDGELSSSESSKRKRSRQQEIPRKKARVLTSLEEPRVTFQISRKIGVWFSEDIFWIILARMMTARQILHDLRSKLFNVYTLPGVCVGRRWPIGLKRSWEI